MRPAPGRIGPADDDELLAIEALRLYPEPAIAGRIGPVDPLRDRTFETQPAGLGPKARAVPQHVLAEAQRRKVLLEQALQPLLALDERQRGGARALEMQQVEDIEHELTGASLVHRRLQAAEGGERHRFPAHRARRRYRPTTPAAPRSCAEGDATSRARSGSAARRVVGLHWERPQWPTPLSARRSPRGPASRPFRRPRLPPREFHRLIGVACKFAPIGLIGTQGRGACSMFAAMGMAGSAAP